jgi:hypothetical protein
MYCEKKIKKLLFISGVTLSLFLSKLVAKQLYFPIYTYRPWSMSKINNHYGKILLLFLPYVGFDIFLFC